MVPDDPRLVFQSEDQVGRSRSVQIERGVVEHQEDPTELCLAVRIVIHVLLHGNLKAERHLRFKQHAPSVHTTQSISAVAEALGP